MPNEKSSSMGLLEAFLLRIRQDAVHQLLAVGRLQIGAVEASQMSVDANLRGRVRRDVEVRSFVLNKRLQQFRQCRHLLHRFPDDFLDRSSFRP